MVFVVSFEHFMTFRRTVVRQAAQRRNGAPQPTRLRRPGVEPRHKLHTDINVVEGISAKLVYLADLRFAVTQAVPKVLGTK